MIMQLWRVFSIRSRLSMFTLSLTILASKQSKAFLNMWKSFITVNEPIPLWVIFLQWSLKQNGNNNKIFFFLLSIKWLQDQGYFLYCSYNPYIPSISPLFTHSYPP